VVLSGDLQVAGTFIRITSASTSGRLRAAVIDAARRWVSQPPLTMQFAVG
jgi:hypothetical protein